MTDERSTFETTKERLEDIVTQVRRKDVSLEASLDLLEEAVRLVNQCNDLIDQTSWRAPQAPVEGEAAPGEPDGDSGDGAAMVEHEDGDRPSAGEDGPEEASGEPSSVGGQDAEGVDDAPGTEPAETIEDDARE